MAFSLLGDALFEKGERRLILVFGLVRVRRILASECFMRGPPFTFPVYCALLSFSF